MDSIDFGFRFIEDLVARSEARAVFEEHLSATGGPHLELRNIEDPGADAGYLRLWAASGNNLLDRMIHFRLQSDPVDTQLFFLFGRAETPMPHFHAQVVQFSPDACVFNADWLPRLDPVEYPDYFTEVFTALNKPYWQATNDRKNICALAPAAPAVAAFLAPWSIGAGRPTDRAELDRVGPNIIAFLEHSLDLAQELKYMGPSGEVLRERDSKHLDCFFDDKLDPRAWKGVYKVIGEDMGRRIKDIFKTGLR